MKASTRYAALAWVVSGGLVVVVASHQRAQELDTDLGISVPAGFEVEKVAAAPLVDRPIVADFDEQGRLYVADSSGSNDNVKKQLEDRPHRIVRLEDGDGDGRFDRSKVFADRMMFPEGTMWFDGSLYVAAPPSIWKLTDTDGDGVADRREEWFQGKTLTNCANDLHGPYLGPDGLIYWTKGAFAQQTYERPGQTPLVTRASHIFRRRPGDAAIESVMTGGMDNPVDVAFTPAGERILTATFLEHPQLGRRDAIVHAVYGGLYGKPHAVIDGHKRTGELMPVMCQLGPAVPAGLTRYASNIFGDDYRDSFFAAMFNLRKVTRHVLEPSGATFTSRDSDFLVSANRDFHPTDVLEDADGSLLVVDTGPWYKLCCPTSQLAKPDLLGAIYRVRRKGAPRVPDPRGLKLAWSTMSPAALTRLLDDRRPAIQNRALNELAKRGSAAVSPLAEALRGSRSGELRRQALWGLTRIDSPSAREAARSVLADRDAGLRKVAIYSAGLWRDGDATGSLLQALDSGEPHVRRAAAEALGRIRAGRAVPDILRAAASQADRILEHSLIYALIEIDDPATTAAGLRSESGRAKRAAMIALDQMDHGALAADSVVPLLSSTDPVVLETAWWIAGRRPEWGGALSGFFEQRLSRSDLPADTMADLQRKLSTFVAEPAIQTLLAAKAGTPSPAPVRMLVLGAMAAGGSSSRMKALPSAWIASLLAALDDPDPEIARRALTVFRASPPPPDSQREVEAALLRAARDATRALDIRIDALAAVPGGLTAADRALLDVLVAAVQPGQPAMIRSAAAGVLEKATLDRAQFSLLSASLARVGPLELPRVLRAYEASADEGVGMELLDALETAAARASLRAETLLPRLAKYPQPVRTRAEALLASVQHDAARQARHLDELLERVKAGDIRRGQAVFNSDRAACLACHAIGYVGGRIGPDLTRIGQIRTERDLLEAIVYPNASFARSYEPVVVSTKSGASHAGVLRSELADEVVLATAARDDIRIPRRDISDIQPGSVSLMPSGLAEQLTTQELADLLAFLKATRSGAN
jgi:putative membrane-bound dehydrogenase-like protein